MSLPASDNFSGTALDANWTIQTGGFSVSSGVVSNTAGNNDSAAFWNADTFPDDQWSQITVSAVTNDWVGVAVRASGTGAARNFYSFRATSSSNSPEWEIFKEVAGVYTSLVTGNTPAGVVNGDVMKLVVQGTTLTGYINGTAVTPTATDSSLTSGSAGIYEYGSSPGLTTWSGGANSSSAQKGGMFFASEHRRRVPLKSAGALAALGWIVDRRRRLRG